MAIKANIKTLILVPAQDRHGGVYNFYENLEDHLDGDMAYFYFGEPAFRFNNKLVVTLIYIFKFVKILFKLQPKLVVLNTSLNLNAVFRDSIYILIRTIIAYLIRNLALDLLVAILFTFMFIVSAISES